MDPSDEVWVMNFLGAVEIVREVLVQQDTSSAPHPPHTIGHAHFWTNGVVEQTNNTMFTALQIPTERPRKLFNKTERHPKYDTL